MFTYKRKYEKLDSRFPDYTELGHTFTLLFCKGGLRGILFFSLEISGMPAENSKSYDGLQVSARAGFRISLDISKFEGRENRYNQRDSEDKLNHGSMTSIAAQKLIWQ